jgi:peptide/nickel transport system substrate-binding protein
MAILIGLFVAGSAPLKYTEDRVPSSVNPLFADDMYGIRITELIFEGMIGWDKQQRPAPQLATSWTIAKDLLSITLDLRRDVKWHDGAPFTSNDVAFTVNAMTNTRSQITDRYLAQIIKGVQIINPHRVTISFKRPINEPLRWMQFKILPAHRFIKQGRTQLPQRSDYFNQRPYGTGPFRLDRWSGKKIIMQRFPEHWRGSKITLNGVILQANPDKDIQREVMRYGGFDAIVRVMPKDILLFERDRNTRLYPYSTNDWWYIAFNHKQGSILRDKRVREALLLALDRDSLRAAHLGDGQVISGPFSPNDPLYNFEVPARGQDLEQANKLFDASGWRKKPGQTYRSKDGKNLQFRFYVPHSRTSYKSLCLAMQGEWQKVGVKIDIVWMDDAKWNQTVFDKKDFDLVLHVWNFDDLSTIYPLFHSKGIRNYIGYQNPEIDRLLTAANNTTDPAIYQAIYRKIHQILNGELPYLFLWSLTNYSAISARVRQVVIHPFNYFHYAYGWSKQ